MRSSKQAAVQKARQTITDEVREFVVEKLFDTIGQMVRDQIENAVKKHTGNGWSMGVEFGIEAAQAFCKVLDEEWFNFEVRLKSSGRAQNDGVKCPPKNVFAEPGERVIDFIFGFSVPSDNKPHANWITADFKLTLAAAASQWKETSPKHEQFEFAAANSRQFNFVPVVGVLSLWRGAKNAKTYSKIVKELRKLGKDEQVMMVLLVVVDGKTKRGKADRVIGRIFG